MYRPRYASTSTKTYAICNKVKKEADIKANNIISEPKILIIGAGAAGIACAAKLLEHGFHDISILEGEDRIGGRIHSVRAGDNVLDIGAQWCHGEQGNAVYELVKDRKLLESSGEIYVNFECIRSNGEVVPKTVGQRLKNLIADVFLNRQQFLDMYVGSLGALLDMQYNQALNSPEFKDIDHTIAKEFFTNVKKIESSETAIGLDEVSAKGMQSYWVCEGDYMLNWKDKGYVEFLRILMKSDETDNDLGILSSYISFNLTARQILWDCEDGKVEVLCENVMNRFKADHVIVTVSLGVLKERHRTMFCPALPQEQQRAIEGLAYGDVCKIFLEFPYSFWPNHWTGFSTLWRDEDATEIRNSRRAWLLEMFGFYCVNYQPRVLLGWVVGTTVKQVEALTKKELTDDCMYLLKRYLNKWTIPEPLNVLSSKWYQNRHFRGAYSFRSMKTEEMLTNPLILSNPLTILAYAPIPEGHEQDHATRPLTIKPVVLFAGEATSEHYFSTVHGAIETGMREANRLAGYYLKQI